MHLGCGMLICICSVDSLHMRDSTCFLQSTELQHCHSHRWPADTCHQRRLQERRSFLNSSLRDSRVICLDDLGLTGKLSAWEAKMRNIFYVKQTNKQTNKQTKNKQRKLQDYTSFTSPRNVIWFTLRLFCFQQNLLCFHKEQEDLIILIQPGRFVFNSKVSCYQQFKNGENTP